MLSHPLGTLFLRQPFPTSPISQLPSPPHRPPSTTDRAPNVNIDLDELITIPVPDDLTSCTLADLRAIRDHHQDVENGLSYARRIVQGRLDTVATEMERRRDGGDGLIERLPGALAGHSRGPGMPRPMPDLEPPAWADELLSSADAALPASQMARLSELGDTRARRRRSGARSARARALRSSPPDASQHRSRPGRAGRSLPRRCHRGRSAALRPGRSGPARRSLALAGASGVFAIVAVPWTE